MELKMKYLGVCLSLISNYYLHKGLKQFEMNLVALYLKCPIPINERSNLCFGCTIFCVECPEITKIVLISCQ